MADPINRLAMFSAPVADDQVNMLAPQLPAGHPSNMLMWLRDQIPQVQADDTSTMSGIYSRLGRTATSIPRAGLETAANWLRGVNDPNAVRIGEDTIAPLGLFGMAGLAARAPRAAATATRSDAAIARDLAARYPEEIAGGDLTRMRIAGANRMGVSGDEGMTSLYRTDGAMHTPGDFVNRAPPLGRPANLLADNAKSSVPGTAAQVMDHSRRLDEVLRSPNREDFGRVLQEIDLDAAGWKALAKEFVGRAGTSKAENIQLIESRHRNIWDARAKQAFIRDTGGAASDPYASSPGLAANATQEDSPVLDILSKYGLY